jgi:hypothetical protein
MMARQNTAKKRSMDGCVSILSRALTQQARLQWIYRSALQRHSWKKADLEFANASRDRLYHHFLTLGFLAC